MEKWGCTIKPSINSSFCPWAKWTFLVSTSLQATKLDCAFVRKDPYGVVLIISPFNYPFQLTLVPMVGAIAAGEWDAPWMPPHSPQHPWPTDPLFSHSVSCWLNPSMWWSSILCYHSHMFFSPLGNCVIVKPSEQSSCSEKLLAEVLPTYLDPVSSSTQLLFISLWKLTLVHRRES